MNTWTVLVKFRDEEASPFAVLADKKPSGDVCKDAARKHRRDWGGAVQFVYRILDPAGNPWQECTTSGTSRLTWRWL